MGNKVYLIDGGQLQQDQSMVTFAIGAGQKIWAQVYSVYVETPDAKIVIETGMDPDSWSPQLRHFLVPRQTSEQRLETALNHIGVSPEDVDVVVNTHLHVEHCGFNRLFRNAVWVVHREELQAALVPEVFESTYFRPAFDVGLASKLIERDYELAKGVSVLTTPGHTAGHLSVSVETDSSGVLLFTGDAAMSKENFWGSERTSPAGWPCATSLNKKTEMRSLERLREYVESTKARTMATCNPMYSHDADEFAKWRHAPQAYE